jgi:hypothetical protein
MKNPPLYQASKNIPKQTLIPGRWKGKSRNVVIAVVFAAVAVSQHHKRIVVVVHQPYGTALLLLPPSMCSS